MILVDRRLSLLSNNFRASNLAQSERSGFPWIVQYSVENIRGTICVGGEGVLEMEKGYTLGLGVGYSKDLDLLRTQATKQVLATV